MELYFKVSIAPPANNYDEMDAKETGTFLTQDIGMGYVNSDKNANRINLAKSPKLIIKSMNQIKASKIFSLLMPPLEKKDTNPIGLELLHGLLEAKQNKWLLTVVMALIEIDKPSMPFDSAHCTKVAFHSHAVSDSGFWLNFYVNGDYKFTKYKYN